MSSASSARAVAAIAGNQLRRVARDRTALFFSLALPLTIIVLIGTTMGAEDLRIAVADLDGSERSAALVDRLEASDAFAVDHHDGARDVQRDVRNGAVAAGLLIGDGYGAGLDRGETVDVELVGEPTSSAAMAVQAAVRGAVDAEGQHVAATRFVVAHADGDLDAAASAVDDASGGLVATEVRSRAPGGGETTDVFGLDYTTPANLVLFVFVNTLATGALLALERQQGLTRRMLASPHGTGTILAGVAAARVAFALAQSAIIVLVGAVVFDVDWGDPLGAAAVVVLFAVVAAAVGLLVGATVANPDQAQAIGIPVAIGMGMLGGCMWPLGIVPEAMRVVGHLTPHAWAMDAWIELVYEDGGLADIALELAVLAGLAAVLGVAAARRLRVALTS